MLNKVRCDLRSVLPEELVHALLASYEVMKHNYLLGMHEPSELNGGKFVEACFRILQYLTGTAPTPLGNRIPNLTQSLRDFEQLPRATNHESYRVHIPRTLAAMYNVRSGRGVAHLGGDVNPNHADATLVVASADWVMAELFRIHYRCSLEDAQAIVDALVQRQLPLVHELEDATRVMSPRLTHKDQTLLLLAAKHPTQVSDAELVQWIEPGDASSYPSKVLKPLHRERCIEYRSTGYCEILPPGMRYVERRIAGWLKQLNEEA